MGRGVAAAGVVGLALRGGDDRPVRRRSSLAPSSPPSLCLVLDADLASVALALLAVVVLAASFGPCYMVVAVVCAFVALNWCFTSPEGSFEIGKVEDVVPLLAFAHRRRCVFGPERASRPEACRRGGRHRRGRIVPRARRRRSRHRRARAPRCRGGHRGDGPPVRDHCRRRVVSRTELLVHPPDRIARDHQDRRPGAAARVHGGGRNRRSRPSHV